MNKKLFLSLTLMTLSIPTFSKEDGLIKNAVNCQSHINKIEKNKEGINKIDGADIITDKKVAVVCSDDNCYYQKNLDTEPGPFKVFNKKGEEIFLKKEKDGNLEVVKSIDSKEEMKKIKEITRLSKISTKEKQDFLQKINPKLVNKIKSIDTKHQNNTACNSIVAHEAKINLEQDNRPPKNQSRIEGAIQDSRLDKNFLKEQIKREVSGKDSHSR